jgi:hypothetical protein
MQLLPGAAQIGQVHQYLSQNSRSYLNWFQWGTYTAIQAGKFSWWLTDTAQELINVPVGLMRTAINAAGTAFISVFTAQIYKGTYGEGVKQRTIQGATTLWSIGFGDGVIKSIFGTSPLAYVWNLISPQQQTGKKAEL